MFFSPKLSIITVSFNCISEIENTILSVINQDYPNIEYIVIDGGSTDGTVEIIRKYSDRITKWISEPDKGIYDAMNKGILMATGEWVTMRNCGDYFAERDSLSKLFAEPVDDSVDFVCGGAYRITDLGYNLVFSKDIAKNNYHMKVVHPATFVRTSWHKQCLFDTRFKVAADFNLVYNSMKAGRKFLYRDIPIVIFPSGGYSSVHWDQGKREGLIIRGLYNTRKQKIRGELYILKLKTGFYLRKLLKTIPFIKKKRDAELIKRLNIRPLPVPVKNFY